jgi:hypothetical protein
MRAWYVECRKGPAVFIEEAVAISYAAKQSGFVTPLVKFNEQEACNKCIHLRQKRKALELGGEQLFKEPSITSKDGEESWDSREGISSCGDCGTCKAEGLEQSPQNGCGSF